MVYEVYVSSEDLRRSHDRGLDPADEARRGWRASKPQRRALRFSGLSRGNRRVQARAVRGGASIVPKTRSLSLPRTFPSSLRRCKGTSHSSEDPSGRFAAGLGFRLFIERRLLPCRARSWPGMHVNFLGRKWLAAFGAYHDGIEVLSAFAVLM